MTTTSLFAGTPQQEIRFHGIVAKAPLFYRRLSFFSALFLADLNEARRLLPTPLHHPVAALPGRALVALHCFEYADCDLGPYNEVALSIAVHHGRPPRLALASLLKAAIGGTFHGFVVDLPVTTEPALWGGIDLYNYPKYLADISFAEDDRERTCTLRDRDSGALILSARLAKPAPRPSARWQLSGKTLTFLSYPRKDGTTLRAEMRVRVLDGANALGGRRRLALDLGEHAHADVFRRLRLSAPLQVMWAPRGEAILAMPVPA